MALLEKQQGTARANAYLAKTFVERTLPRVESVNQRYQLHAMRPASWRNCPERCCAARCSQSGRHIVGTDEAV
ncbi:hypothetical protein [Pantoea sp. SGAir0180]